MTEGEKLMKLCEKEKGQFYGELSEKETRYDVYSSEDSKTQVVDLDDDVSFRITQFPDELVIVMYVNGSEITLTKNFKGHYALDVQEDNKLKYYDVVLKHEQDSDSMLPYIDID